LNGFNYTYFAKKEEKAEFNPPFPIILEQAQEKNDQGYGIFFCPNEYTDRRKIENITRINHYYIDIDSGEKKDQLKKIGNGLKPSWLIESKRGYQAHWFVRNSDNTDLTFKKIARRLVDFYNSDSAVINPVMLLRVPGFYHCKDLADKFLVNEVFKNNMYYSEQDLLYCFPESEVEKKVKKASKREISSYGNNFFEKLGNLDQMSALERLSGVIDNIEFKQNGGGTYQIWCNGKSTSCWIDKDRMIGSHSKGSPTIWQWLKWYGFSNKEIYAMIKERIPEVCR
jgi:hypothetical protein